MKVEIVVNSSQIAWYKSKGYDIPVERVQLFYTNKKGHKKKNGVEYRVRNGTKIWVDVLDLPTKSNQTIFFDCIECGSSCTTTWQAFQQKQTPNKCRGCKKKEVKNTGCHSYWVDKLINKNDFAQCDISGERDKRFLVLHHLVSRKNGGKNEKSNYVILSANYHLAFHNWNGGMNIPCNAEQYYEFREQEKARMTESFKEAI